MAKLGFESVVEFVIENVDKEGNLLDDKGKVVTTIEAVMSEDDKAGQAAIDAVIAEMRRREGGSEDGSPVRAVARHFLINEAGQILKSRATGNKGSEKRAARSRLALAGRIDHPEETTTVVTLVESASGVSVFGASCAEDVFTAFGLHGESA